MCARRWSRVTFPATDAFTRRCEAWLAARLNVPRAHLTNSATAGLEMAALLADIGPGDEVVMPSFTFVSCANAVALRGATPVFVDIRPDTLGIDVDRLRAGDHRPHPGGHRHPLRRGAVRHGRG